MKRREMIFASGAPAVQRDFDINKRKIIAFYIQLRTQSVHATYERGRRDSSGVTRSANTQQHRATRKKENNEQNI